MEAGAIRNITAAIAQLAARRSHNPKVVSSILTRRILGQRWRKSVGTFSTADAVVQWALPCTMPVRSGANTSAGASAGRSAHVQHERSGAVVSVLGS